MYFRAIIIASLNTTLSLYFYALTAGPLRPRPCNFVCFNCRLRLRRTFDNVDPINTFPSILFFQFINLSALLRCGSLLFCTFFFQAGSSA